MLKTIFTILTLIIVTACSSTTYSTQESDEAYIQLQGNFLNSVLAIDGAKIQIDEQTQTYDLNGVQVAKFPVTLGAHQVVVYKTGQIVYRQNIFVSHGQTVEVKVP